MSKKQRFLFPSFLISRRWLPDCKVPYTIDPNFTHYERAVIIVSMADIEAVSDVRWVPRIDNENPYVRIKKDEAGCFATVGKVPDGILNLGPGCFVRGYLSIY